MTKTTTPETAAAWADAQVRRHTSWPLDILGTGPHCTGNCRQGRALCVHPVECGVQRPVEDKAPASAEASTEVGAEPRSGCVPVNSVERKQRLLIGGVVVLLVVLALVSFIARVFA